MRVRPYILVHGIYKQHIVQQIPDTVYRPDSDMIILNPSVTSSELLTSSCTQSHSRRYNTHAHRDTVISLPSFFSLSRPAILRITRFLYWCRVYPAVPYMATRIASAQHLCAGRSVLEDTLRPLGTGSSSIRIWISWARIRFWSDLLDIQFN